MTTIDYIRTPEPRASSHAFPVMSATSLIVAAARALATWHGRRRDRAAFMTLLGKEDWVYKDLGIHRGDVEWAARLPLSVNAALEMEKLRTRSRK